MSDHVTQSPQIYIDTPFRLSTLTLEAGERLLKQQSEAIRAALAENSQYLKALLDATDWAAASREWPALYQANAQRILDVTRGWLEITSGTQIAAVKVFNESFSDYQREMQQGFDRYFDVFRKRRIAAAAQMKDSLGRTWDAIRTQQAAIAEKIG